MVRLKGLVFLLLFAPLGMRAQYAPPAGQPGSTAIAKDSSVFVAWATGCQVIRGPVDITNPGGGIASYGDETAALGPAEGNSADVVSLGDGGQATLTFDVQIADGDGWDFAVFENALNDTFLELALVQVSSNGTDFYTFPAVSLTPDSAQVPTFGEVNCTKINNLAGKYRQGYGTPFDLADFCECGYPDLQHITHIRIVDAVGCIDDEYATFDSQGHKINDPWPTPFETGGFDLDAVGVIHTSGAGIGSKEQSFVVFPNPCQGRFSVRFPYDRNVYISLYSPQRLLLSQKKAVPVTDFDLSAFPAGVYFLEVSDGEDVSFVKIIKTK